MPDRDPSNNPWLSIPASDYEGHMASPGVRQLQFLSRVFGEVLARYRPRSIVVPGCTTGNGFEHIDTRTTHTVIGIDINPEYLLVLKKRFGSKIPGLRLECADAAACELPVRSIELVHCALLFEYVAPRTLVAKTAGWLAPGGRLSVVLQLASPGHGKVTPSAFTSLERLEPVMHLVTPSELGRLAAEAGFSPVEDRVETLESGKQFHVGVYGL